MRRHDQPVDLLVAVIGQRENRPILSRLARAYLDAPDDAVVPAEENDTAGAVRAVETLATGLQWRRVQVPLAVVGTPGRADLDACWELGAAVAAGLTLD